MSELDAKRASTQERLTQHGQEHLLRHWDELSVPERENLLEQIDRIDFDLLNSLYADLVLKPRSSDGPGTLEPLRAEPWSAISFEDRRFHLQKGWQALQEGKVAVLLVAGGQGSRLGHEGPKGTYDIGLPSGKSLFQLQAERLLLLTRLAGRPIPWYIMTSPENHTVTVEYFRSHAYFGIAEADIFFFPQGTIPLLDASGKILLADKGMVNEGPNGNGACFEALNRSGALADMERRGAEQVFFYGVDNALVRVADPAFIGYCIDKGASVGAKAVRKAYPEEKVGVFCTRDGRPAVAEYSDLPADLATAVGPEGCLLFDAANIVIHMFRLDFIRRHADGSLPYHAAHKKVACLDETGALVKPESPNAWKFELFMFDIFARAEAITLLEVRREEEFAPVKNLTGVDSPETARNLILELHRKWALEAGVAPHILQDKVIEISPLTTYSGEGLDARKVFHSGNNVLLM